MSGALSVVSFAMGVSVVLWGACAVSSMLALLAWRAARLQPVEVVVAAGPSPLSRRVRPREWGS